MSLRRVRVPEGLHRTRSVLTNCRPEDDSLPAVVPAERVGGRTRDALRAQGVTVRKEWAVRTGDKITSGDEGATRLLDGADPRRRPTGIFCCNDPVAAGVLHATTRLGMAVPGELSVVGYEDPDTESRTGRDAHGDGSRSLGARARPAVAAQDDGARRRTQLDRQRPVRRPQQGDAVRPCAVTVRSYDTGSGTGPGVVANGSGARGSSSSGAGVIRSEPSVWTPTTRGAVSVPAQPAATTSAASRASHDQPHIRARPALFAAGGTAVFRNTVIREFTV